MTIVQTKAEAIEWLLQTIGASSDTIDRLDRYSSLVQVENGSQNLVAASTLGDAFWVRHVIDSAQLVPLAGSNIAGARWYDIGSGAGLPGIVVALIAPSYNVTLVEPRARRCEFLRSAVVELGLSKRVRVAQGKAEALQMPPTSVLSARALAPLERLISATRHLSDDGTIWLLPKGEKAVNELSTLAPQWQQRFHVEPSVTQFGASILVGRGGFPR